jgi:hypothetical protein
MKSMFDRFLIFLLLIVKLICLGLIWGSCSPGGLEDITFLGILILYLLRIPLLIVLVILISIGAAIWLRYHWQAKPRKIDALSAPKPSRRYAQKIALIICGVVLATSILLKLNLPQRIAFAISTPAFNSFLADSAQVEHFCDSTSAPSINQQFGFYWVQECDRDPRGGIYFKTYDRSGIVWYAESHGFAYRPNAKGSRRFGSGKASDIYQYASVWGDWYWFKAGKTY